MKRAFPLVTKPGGMVHQRITATVRDEILAGKFVPGTQLPSTRELARNWKTSIFTIHTALKVLVKEGWIERRNGAGTYIADPRNRFLRAGIYQRVDVAANEQSAFIRGIHISLLKQLEQLKKEVQYFTDSRPEEEQGVILPSLAKAIRDRSIQCVFAPAFHDVNARSLAELPVPTAFVSNPFSSSQVTLDERHFFRESARRLAAEGCRSVGIMSTMQEWPKGQTNGDFYGIFRKIMGEEGLVTRENWIRMPRQWSSNHESYGYEEFKNLWKLPKKPDGLMVYPDGVVRGCILAALELGIKTASSKMKFVFHVNASARFLCPFDVTWAITDEALMARAMIELIQKQFNGEETSLIKIPFSFESTGSGSSSHRQDAGV